MPKVKRVLEEEKFDIIHLHEPCCPLLPWIVLRLSHSINVGTFHAYYEHSMGYWVGRPFLNQFFDRLDGKIAVSEPALRCITRYFPGHYRLIPHGIDLEHFASGVSPIEEFRDGKLNILFVSRLEKRKGLDYLLKAYEQVKAEFPSSRLIVVGPDGRLRQGYAKKARERKLEDVVFTGYVSYADLPRYYHTADIFCAPAVGKESFGIILLEAMAAHKPIIATNIEGYSSVVTHGVEGLLVPPKDEEALAQALLSLFSDQALRHQMGVNGGIKAEAHSWGGIAQKTIEYYHELLEGKASEG
jgi:phosphatidylinositol alpha-mannosyltransferase